MALAKKCDICGKFYERYTTTDKEPNGILIIHSNDTNSDYWSAGRGKMDCCPECLKAVHDCIDKLKHPEVPVKIGDLLGNTDDDLK